MFKDTIVVKFVMLPYLTIKEIAKFAMLTKRVYKNIDSNNFNRPEDYSSHLDWIIQDQNQI